MEKILAYDVAVGSTHSNALWRILRVARPRGVRLLPPHWAPGPTPPAGRLPLHPISLILQYKRPEYMHGTRAAQWARWRTPYFRITRTNHQHRVLRQLETRLASDLVVRYVAPVFHTYADLDVARFAGRVLAESGFVSPNTLGTHRVWSYQRPGTMGYPNPRGSGAEFEGLRALFSAMREARSVDLERRMGGELEQADPFGDHLQRLADAFRYRQPALRDAVTEWAVGLLRERDLSLSAETVRALVNVVTVQSGAHQLGASWHIAGEWPAQM